MKELIKVFETVFSGYQMHIFAVVIYYAFQQFKMNKRIEVQIAKCSGRYEIIDLKLKNNRRDTTEIKEELKSVKIVKGL